MFQPPFGEPVPRSKAPSRAILLALVACCACGGESGSESSSELGAQNNGTNGGSGTEGDGDGNSAGPSDEATCEAPGFVEPSSPQSFRSLQATVIDLDGNPVPDLRAQACGTDLCLNHKTDESGLVLIEDDSELIKPAFKYGVGTEFAKFAYPLSSGPEHEIGEQRTVRFPDPATSTPLEPGTQVTSSGVTLDLAADMNDPEPDPFDFDTDALKGFRAALVPVDLAPPAVDPELGLELVVAMTPVGAELCPAAKMTVENTLGLDPGTAVEFVLHGVEVDEQWAPYGGWAKVADGSVTADGTAITTNDGEGIPILSVVGIRPASN